MLQMIFLLPVLVVGFEICNFTCESDGRSPKVCENICIVRGG